jgi:serine/threonine-protein kinase RsbW
LWLQAGSSELVMRTQKAGQGKNMAEPVEITLSIPCKPEYIALCRLTVGAIGSREGLDSETVADLKVAVTEAATWLIGPSCPDTADEGAISDHGLTARFTVSPDAWRIDVSHASQYRARTGASTEDDLGLMIIEALVDEVEQHEDPDSGTVVHLVKYLSGPKQDR